MSKSVKPVFRLGDLVRLKDSLIQLSSAIFKVTAVIPKASVSKKVKQYLPIDVLVFIEKSLRPAVLLQLGNRSQRRQWKSLQKIPNGLS